MILPGEDHTGIHVASMSINLGGVVNAFRAFEPGPIAMRAVLATQLSLIPPSQVPWLVCEWLPPVPRTSPGAHRIPGLVPDGWLVLGAGNGLRAKITGSPSAQFRGQPTKVVTEVAPAPVAPDGWKRPF